MPCNSKTGRVVQPSVRIWVALVVVAGCTRPAAPPPPHVEPTDTVVRPLPTRPRPNFSLTFMLEGLPPPLTRAPGLEPALQVAPYWPAVCERRSVVLPDEVLEYLFAWCRSRSGKLDDLAGILARARHSSNHELAEAAAEDLANLAADGVDVGMDPRVVDYLAAIYVFRDDSRDAIELLDRARRYGSPPEIHPEDCERTVLRLLAQFDRATVDWLAVFRSDPCLRDAELLTCAADRVRQPAATIAEQDSVSGMCGGRAMTDAEIRRVRLAEAYWRWHADEPATWNAVVTAAIDAMVDVPGSEELAVSILEDEAAAVCKPAIHDDARTLARLVSTSPGHDARFDDRIKRVFGHEPTCFSAR